MFNDIRAAAALTVQAELGEDATYTPVDGSAPIATVVIVHRHRQMVSSNDMQRMNFADVAANTITLFTTDVPLALQKRGGRIDLADSGDAFTLDTIALKRDEFKATWKVNAVANP